MRFMGAWLRGGLFGLAMMAAANAALAQDAPPECQRDETSLACAVALETIRSLSAWSAALDRTDPTWSVGYEPSTLFPRLAAAEGELDIAVAHVIRLLPEAYPEYVWSFTMGDLRATAWAITRDPLPAEAGINAATIDDADLARAGFWAQVTAARALAAVGKDEAARALFRAAAEDRFADPGTDPRRFHNIAYSILSLWAASGYPDDALAFASEERWHIWDEYGRLAVADGLAATGNVAATRAVIDTLGPPWSILGKFSIAEAERRSGNPETARALVDAVWTELQETKGWFANQHRLRAAVIYALLGDLDAMHEALGTLGTRPHAYLTVWPKLTPYIACHDLQAAIDLLIPTEDGIPAKLRWPRAWDLVDPLIAAAASGQGEAAYAVARHAPRPDDGTLFLMATLIGLRQAQDLPSDAPPCSTLMLLPGWD